MSRARKPINDGSLAFQIIGPLRSHVMKDRAELHGQTALRGIAALVVFIAHAAFFRHFSGGDFFRKFYQIFFWHNEAVDLFFELSGFILCYVYLDRNFKWRDYFVARFARIYPVYLVALGLTLVLFFHTMAVGGGWNGFTVPSIVANIFLVQDWPLIPLQPSLNTPTWSISAEIFLYIFIFPCLFAAEKYLGLWLKIALIIVPVAISVIVMSLTWGISPEGTDNSWSPANPWRGILSFTSGFFVCSVGLRKGFPRIFPRWGEVIFLVVAASCLMFQFPFNRKIALLSFPLLTYLSAREDSILTTLLRGSFFAWLGDISYSVYVWHWSLLHLVTMVLTHLRKITGHAFWESGYLAILFSVLVVFTVAHLSHFHFERPVNRWLRRRLSRADPLPVTMR